MTNYDNRDTMGLVSATYTEGINVIAQLACLVYDEESGAVVHGHGAFILEGGVVPSEEEFQKKALEMAHRTRELGGRNLQTRMVDPAEVPSGPMRVDPVTRQVIAEEEPRRTPPGMPGSKASSSRL